jgi:thymidylate synthase ThyX
MIITSEIQVSIIHSTPASLPGRVARCCYGKRKDVPDDKADITLSANLLNSGHHEPIECSLIVFECLLPKFVCSQLNRHRIGIGRCQQSLRLSFAEPTFFWPQDLELSAASRARFADDARLISMLREQKATKREREILQRHISEHLIVQYSTWFNTRQWITFSKRRLAHDAQRETQQAVRLMEDAILLTDWKDVLGGSK